LGIVLVELLLMGAAFVGGRMLAEQNGKSARPQGAIQLPAQLPRDPMAANGAVSKIQDTLITLTRGRGGPGGGGGSTANNQIEVAVTADTKYYKGVAPAPGGPNPQGGQALQVQDAALSDVKVGGTIMVWGPRNGERITAEVIYIQPTGR
jgi:hypothetical protein